ncbi:MAG: bifunctional diguanylate cyclase/phosphodiesterase [Halothiobacillaceae bacterium]
MNLAALSLRSRLAIGFVLVGVLPLVILALFYLHSYERALTETVLQNLANVADRKADQIDRHVQERLADAVTLASLPSVQDALLGAPPDQLPETASRLLERGDYRDLKLIDPTGTIRLSTRFPERAGQEVGQIAGEPDTLPEAFDQATSFLHTDLSPFRPAGDGSLVAHLVVPVIRNEQLIGAVALSLTRDSLDPVLFDETGLGHSGRTSIVVAEDGAVTHFTPFKQNTTGSAASTDVPPSAIAAVLSGAEGRAILATEGGREKAASWRYLPALQAGMIVQMDAAEALAPWQKMQQTSSWALVAILLASLLAARLIGDRLLRNEAQTERQRALYRAIFETMNEGAVLYRRDPDSGQFEVLDLNPAGEKISGVPRTEVLGRDLTEAFPGVRQIGLPEQLEHAWQTRESQTIGERLYRSGTLQRWVENSIVALPGREILVIFRDITERRRTQDALQDSLHRLREAQRIARMAAWTLPHDSDQLLWSDESGAVFGGRPESVAPTLPRLLDHVLPADRDRVERLFDPAGADDRREAIFRIRREDGRIRWLRAQSENRHDAQDRPLSCVGTLQDITEQQESAEALQLYANVFENSGEAILITDADNRVITCNPAFVRLTGYALADILGKDPKFLHSDRTPPETYRRMWEALKAKDFWQGELWDRHRNGHVYPKWAAISCIRDQQGQVSNYMASFTDISERKAAAARIEHLAHHDSLTGLYNRSNLEIRLSQELVNARRASRILALLFIDLDRFKIINDTLGHHVGDQVLINAARRLENCVTESDILARPGGDEFLVVLTGLTQIEQATDVGNRILEHLAKPYRLDGETLHSTPSIGIALYPDDGEDVATLLKNADAALYHAKAQGRNHLAYFTPELNVAAQERLELERSLREAVQRREFVLHYQPQVLASCPEQTRPHALEALIRWHHPKKGLVSPARFIPVAEETGFIREIGRWVIHEACRQFGAWKNRGIAPERVAVNLSMQQLNDPALLRTVTESLRTHGLEDGELELEITESATTHNPEQAISVLWQLRDAGVRLAVDDFGTGYSSLAYLKRLPLHTLKLDRTFVRDLETDSNDAAIAAATIAMAHQLGLEVTAEGIETPGQRDFLIQQGCDQLQGFLFGHPVTPRELESRWSE